MTEPTGAALLTAVAEARGMPESLVERSAKARAEKTGMTVDEVLREWAEEAESPKTEADSPKEADSRQPTADSPKEADSPKTETDSQQQTADRPEAEAAVAEDSISSSPSGGGGAEGGGGGQTLSGAALLTAVSEARGLPESMIERSAKARAGAAGVDLEDVLHEWAEEEGLEEVTPAKAPRREEGDRRQQTADSPKVADSEQQTADSPKAEAVVAVDSSSSPSGGGAAEGGGGGQTLSGAALLTAVAEARGMPESLTERSAKARAKKTDATVDDVLHEWAQEAGLVADSEQPTADSPEEADSQQPTADSPKAVPVAAELTGAALLTAVAEARGMPESLTERSAKARAKKTDATVDDVLNEWAQEAGLLADSEQQTADSPKAEPVVAAAVGLTGAALLAAVAEARGMPESLTERSAKARAKKTDATVDDVLNEWAQEAGLVADSPEEADSRQQTADSPKVEAVVAVDSSSSPSGGGAAEGGGGGQALDDADAQEPAAGKVKTWRHAIAVGAIVGLVPLVILIAFAVLVDVPSDLSEAPWYLLGLQPFLTYLDPFIVLVIIPGVALASVIVLSVVAWSPSVRPSLRRLALMVLVFLVLAIVALTIIGALWS